MSTSVPIIDSVKRAQTYDGLPDETKFIIWAALQVRDDKFVSRGSMRSAFLAGSSNRAVQRDCGPIHPLTQDTIILRAGWGLNLFEPNGALRAVQE